jgi:aminopeptidase
LLKKIAPVAALYHTYLTNWLVAGVPVPGWSASLFPGLPAEEQEARMWETIFHMCRIDQPDPLAAWRMHLDGLSARSQYLNAKQYRTLRYRAPGPT